MKAEEKEKDICSSLILSIINNKYNRENDIY